MEKEKINYLIRYFLYVLPLKEMTTLEYPYLDEKENIKEEERSAKLIIESYEDKVFWNNCPKCKKLARTPKAK